MNRHFGFISIGILLFLLSGHTSAHKASDSYLRFKMENGAIQAQWDIALRDLDYAIGLDNNGDGRITWGELRVRHQAVTEYALSRLQIHGDGSRCQPQIPGHLVDHHTDGAYAVLRFAVICPTAIDTFEVAYGLLFDLDSLHRGLLQVDVNGRVQTGVLSPGQRKIRLDLGNSAPWREFLQFGREGVWHIWIGFDHILFLVSLLLPAVLCWQAGRWLPRYSLRLALWEVFKIVTAFTIAHSITLCLAVLGLVSLPSRWVESVIAASVLLAALHNLYPVIRTRLWVMTFIFGLIHGLGFASVLIDLGLPGQSLAFALAGFNLGVEAGQIVIVGLFVPLAFMLRHTRFYQRYVLRFGSVLIALIAGIWLVERSMELDLGLPGLI
ncbi:HupE / UreJ protein [Nitrosomonas sp. Nm51]|uniref:HupE/UreJ family protein n=1 Tax=Nitrosomonas sp. Nm51 TaxID=133720 RepID=UPI0008D14364|nr:HupE/UreJ family protein [Nitrosomonas sp. Nm51]SER14898.1 HupE / UreJ protein [Nitrosomonas sp. Nm51]